VLGLTVRDKLLASADEAIDELPIGRRKTVDYETVSTWPSRPFSNPTG
jgi:hypothetical protein